MSGVCTHIECSNPGVARLTETSKHWLCNYHLQVLRSAMEQYAKTQDVDDMKRMIGVQIRANGGAEAMAKSMGPSIETAAKMIDILNGLKGKKQ